MAFELIFLPNSEGKLLLQFVLLGVITFSSNTTNSVIFLLLITVSKYFVSNVKPKYGFYPTSNKNKT